MTQHYNKNNHTSLYILTVKSKETTSNTLTGPYYILTVRSKETISNTLTDLYYILTYLNKNALYIRTYTVEFIPNVMLLKIIEIIPDLNLICISIRVS